MRTYFLITIFSCEVFCLQFIICNKINNRKNGKTLCILHWILKLKCNKTIQNNLRTIWESTKGKSGLFGHKNWKEKLKKKLKRKIKMPHYNYYNFSNIFCCFCFCFCIIPSLLILLNFKFSFKYNFHHHFSFFYFQLQIFIGS